MIQFCNIHISNARSSKQRYRRFRLKQKYYDTTGGVLTVPPRRVYDRRVFVRCCIVYICSVYDLYWSMFRFSMSEHGPRTRSKRARSILTHFRGPESGATFTVAALGLSSSSAISPRPHHTHRTVPPYSSYPVPWGR